MDGPLGDEFTGHAVEDGRCRIVLRLAALDRTLNCRSPVRDEAVQVTGFSRRRGDVPAGGRP